MDDNDNLVEYYKNNRYRKLNNTDEKSNEETINNYRLTKAELEKQLKNFHRLKIKNCKNRVGETLNDLIKLKSKNILRILKNYVILNLMMIYFLIIN